MTVAKISRRHTVGLTFVAVSAFALLGCEKKPKQVELRVETDGDFPMFKQHELTVPTGAHVKLTFHHEGEIITQSHNWVLVKPGKTAAVEDAGQDAGEENNWLKKGDLNVIAATPLIGKGQDATIEFTAPAPGDYPYICTTPGHADDMHGILHVTPN